MSEVNIDVGLGAQRKPVERRSSDQPFRIAVLGDFSGRANRAVKAAGPRLAGRKPILIDPDNFEEVISNRHRVGRSSRIERSCGLVLAGAHPVGNCATGIQR